MDGDMDDVDDESSRGFLEDEVIGSPAERNSFCLKIRNEFQWKYLGFKFECVEAFTQCQWHWSWWIFLLYRCTVAMYAAGITFYSIIAYNHGQWVYPWPVWFTNWSYLFLTLHLVCSAVLAIFGAWDNKHQRFVPLSVAQRNRPGRDLPFYVKLSWFLFVIASVAAIFVTIVYFATIFPFSNHRLDAENINLHLMNSVIIVLEFSISGIPVRLLHVVYAIMYCAVYLIFTVFYWSFDHARVLYPGVVDWNHPYKTLGLTFGFALVGIPCIQLIFFVCYQVRCYLNLVM